MIYRIFTIWLLIGLLLLLFWELPEWLYFANSIFMILYAAAVLAEGYPYFFQKTAISKSLFILGSIGVTTLLIEALSVYSGFPFGEYRYTPMLGLPILNVPFTIAIAWVGFIVNSTMISTQKNKWLRALETGTWVVLIDLILDPVALAWDFWQWNEGGFYYGIPATNFITWFILAAVLSLLLPLQKDKAANHASFRLLQLMFLFFGLLALKKGFVIVAGLAIVFVLITQGRKVIDSGRKKALVH
ncbi:carotenoid biosynthesis protein [Terribacillus sp. DMT04]|uniref:carotenoid biosynthesis protein n=1 Tax=Terribacillus sp. DMT04 TaxID=2850441 RepID=UPI001C2BE9F5|nr:carotenoid biosynthesis protein [Terribacillus sp. DMT04]QXE00236.1 carotenoid biosynthesis protein [Terribacillus sp. DMT04]